MDEKPKSIEFDVLNVMGHQNLNRGESVRDGATSLLSYLGDVQQSVPEKCVLLHGYFVDQLPSPLITMIEDLVRYFVYGDGFEVTTMATNESRRRLSREGYRVMNRRHSLSWSSSRVNESRTSASAR